jgi:hypothetical protein
MADAPAPKPDTEQQPVPVAPNAEVTETATEAAVDTSATTGAMNEVATPETQPEAQPEPQPAAEPTPAPEPASTTPTVASSVDVPASPAAAASASAEQEGGEWDLLVEKLRSWIASGQLQELWQTARTPLSLLAGLVAVLLVLRIYSALLNVIDSIPLASGLLELVGVIAVVQFSLKRLVRSQDRREVIDGLKQRWQSFRGRAS